MTGYANCTTCGNDSILEATFRPSIKEGKGQARLFEGVEAGFTGHVEILKILFVVGSLRRESLNRQCAQALSKMMEEKGVECTFLEFEDVPDMNQDIEFPPPASVERVRAAVKEADGIWFVTPEYNGSYPGLLKNLIDWLSRPLEPGASRQTAVIFGKRCTVTSVAGGAKGKGVLSAMQPLLAMMGAKLMPDIELGIGYTREELTQSKLEMTPARIEALEKQMQTFQTFVQSEAVPPRTQEVQEVLL